MESKLKNVWVNNTRNDFNTSTTNIIDDGKKQSGLELMAYISLAFSHLIHLPLVKGSSMHARILDGQ